MNIELGRVSDSTFALQRNFQKLGREKLSSSSSSSSSSSAKSFFFILLPKKSSSSSGMDEDNQMKQRRRRRRLSRESLEFFLTLFQLFQSHLRQTKPIDPFQQQQQKKKKKLKGAKRTHNVNLYRDIQTFVLSTSNRCTPTKFSLVITERKYKQERVANSPGRKPLHSHTNPNSPGSLSLAIPYIFKHVCANCANLAHAFILAPDLPGLAIVHNDHSQVYLQEIVSL